MKFLRLFAFFLLFCNLVVGAQVKVYSLTDVWNLLEKRPYSRLFLFIQERGVTTRSFVRVVYLLNEKRMLIDVAPTTIAVSCQSVCEMKTDDPIIVEKFGTERSGKMFDASLFMISNGPEFGSDDRDQYSPINQKLLHGKEIGSDAKVVFASYLQIIGEILEHPR